jgi:hypothetical protein
MAGTSAGAKKALETTKERHGEDFFKNLWKHRTNPYKGNSEHMKQLAQKRWEQYRRENEKKENQNQE